MGERRVTLTCLLGTRQQQFISPIEAMTWPRAVYFPRNSGRLLTTTRGNKELGKPKSFGSVSNGTLVKQRESLATESVAAHEGATTHCVVAYFGSRAEGSGNKCRRSQGLAVGRRWGDENPRSLVFQSTS